MSVTYRCFQNRCSLYQSFPLCRVMSKLALYVCEIPTSLVSLHQSWWYDRLSPVINIFVQSIEYDRGRWAFGRLGAILRTPSAHQQLPQLIRKPRRWSVRSAPFEDSAHDGRSCGDIAERVTSRNDLPRELNDTSMGWIDVKALTSRTVIPNA